MSKSQGSPSRSVHHNNLMNKAGSVKLLKACIGVPVSAQPQMQQQEMHVRRQQALYSIKNKDVTTNDSQNVGKQLLSAVCQGPPPGLPVHASSPSTSPPVPISKVPLEPSILDRLISMKFGDDGGTNTVQAPVAANTASSTASLKELLKIKKSGSPTSVSNSAASTTAQDAGAQLKNMLKVGTQHDQHQQSQPQSQQKQQRQQKDQEQWQEKQRQHHQSAVSTKTRSASMGDKKTHSNGKDGNRSEKERSSSLGDSKKERANNKKGKEGTKQALNEGSLDSTPSVNFATSKFFASPDPVLMPMPDFDDFPEGR